MGLKAVAVLGEAVILGFTRAVVAGEGSVVVPPVDERARRIIEMTLKAITIAREGSLVVCPLDENLQKSELGIVETDFCRDL